MKRQEVDRIIEAKLEELTDEIITRLKALPGDVWTGYVDDLQRGQSLSFEEYEGLLQSECGKAVSGLSSFELELLWLKTEAYWEYDTGEPSGRGTWEEGVSSELFRRVTSAAEAEEPELDDGDEEIERYEFDVEELAFISKVAMLLDRPALFEGLGPSESSTVRKLITSLWRSPDGTPDSDIRLEIALNLGEGSITESCACVVAVGVDQIEISAFQEEEDPQGGIRTTIESSFVWYPGGVSEKEGASWWLLERLEFVVDSPHSIKLKDGNCEGEPAST